MKDRLFRFYQGADALGTQRLLHHAAILDHLNFLKVGPVRAIGLALREGYVMTEGCGLATVSAFCHFLFLSCLKALCLSF
jgi:hypothetical protein